MLNHLANEATMVEEARAGNAQAFTSLVNHYERNIYRLALNITASPQDAEDVLQETFLKAYIKLGQFRGQSRFYTWLVRIAVNESLMNLRRQRKSRRWVSLDEPIQTEGDKPLPQEIVDWEENPEQRYARKELQQILIRAIQHLEPGYRATFFLLHVQDLSIQETATLLNLSVPAVKSRLFRARLELRERLNKYFMRLVSLRESGGSHEQREDTLRVGVHGGLGGQPTGGLPGEDARPNGLGLLQAS